MKKIIGIIKEYKLQILLFLFILFFFRSCVKSSQLRNLEKNISNYEITIDSLNIVINKQSVLINNIPLMIKDEKIKTHTEYDNWISSKDRGPQLMELHFIVKDNIKQLQSNN